MVKPHEARLRHQESEVYGYIVDIDSGLNVAIIQKDYEYLCSLLAAAPDMARALLGELDPDGHVIACGNGGDDPCDCSPRCQRVTAALRKAGMLP